MIINPAKLEAAFYTFSLSFQEGLKTVTQIYPSICRTVTSPSKEMRYAWAANVPGFRLWDQGTERIYNNISGREYSIFNYHWENSIQVGADDISDDQIGIYQQSMNLLGVNAGCQPDVLMFNIIQQGNVNLCFDGTAFFSSAHPVSLDNAGLGTYSNLFTTAGGDPRVLNAANFAYVRAQMQSRRLENGLPIPLGKLKIVVPPDLRTTAEQIVNLGMFAPATAYGAIAAQASDNALKGAADIVVSPYLPNNGANSTWYMTSEMGSFRPFIYQERQAMRFLQQIDPNQTPTFDRNVYNYGADVRNNGGYSFPYLAAMCGA